MSQAEQLDGTDTELDFDTPETAAVSIVTQGDPFRSLVCVVRSLVEEATIHFDEDGFSLQAVDPANVGLVDLDVPAGSLTGYEITDSEMVGMPFGQLADALSFARKRSGDGDPVRIDLFDEGTRYRCRVAVLRPDQNVRRISEFYTIDPDSVREEPELPDLDLDHYASPELDAFTDAIDEMQMEYGWITREEQTLIFGTQPTRNPNLDEDSEMVELYDFPATAWGTGECEGSLFSLDYLEDMVKALDRAKCDRLTFNYGNEFPVEIRGEWTEWGFTAKFMLSPRIDT